MIAKGTSDEQSYYISQQRENKMKEQLDELKQMEGELESELREEQADLSDFGERETPDDQPFVYIDNRESKSDVGKSLDRMGGVTLKLETLDVGDYIVSERVAIERKEVTDFINSLISSERGLFDQVSELASAYEKPVVIVEGANGVSDLYGKAQVDEEAIRSALQSLTIDFGVSLLFTRSEEETAKNVRSLARREQVENDEKISKHGSKSTDSLKDTQEYVVSSMPSIGPVLAEKLLAYFGSVYNVLTADVEELQKVEGVGEKKAQKIVNVIESEYE
jgi:Fanconi anemia group M protein